MGAGLAAEAAVKFGDVGYDAYRVLVWMALQALDTEGDRGQPPRLFFGGRDTLVERIRPGLPPKTDSTPDARRKRHNAYRDLQAAQETLVACGALVRVGGIARDGNKQTWRLALNRRAGRSERQERKRLREAARRARLKAEREAVDNGLEGGALSRAQGGALSRTEDGALSPSRVGHCPTPIRTEEPLEERLEEPEDNRSRSNGSPREEPEDDGNWPGHFADEPDPFRLRVVK
jgi:hypothetical protein